MHDEQGGGPRPSPQSPRPRTRALEQTCQNQPGYATGTRSAGWSAWTLAALRDVDLQTPEGEDNRRTSQRCGREETSWRLLRVFVSLAVTLSGCGGSGRGTGPTVDPPATDTGAAMVLAGVLKGSKSPAIARYGARLPPPSAVTCEALTIGCEGGLGPIHYGSVREHDSSDFDYRERRRGVSLAGRTRVLSEGDEMTDHRAWTGWINHRRRL